MWHQLWQHRPPIHFIKQATTAWSPYGRINSNTWPYQKGAMMAAHAHVKWSSRNSPLHHNITYLTPCGFHFYAMTLTSNLLTFNVCVVYQLSRDQTPYNFIKDEKSAAKFTRSIRQQKCIKEQTMTVKAIWPPLQWTTTSMYGDKDYYLTYCIWEPQGSPPQTAAVFAGYGSRTLRHTFKETD